MYRNHFDAIQEFAPTVHRVSPLFEKRGDDATYKNHNHHPMAGYCPNPNLIPRPDGGPSPTAASSALPACARRPRAPLDALGVEVRLHHERS